MTRETTVRAPADDIEESTDEPRQRYVVHLTVTSTDLPAAQPLARTLARSLHFLPELLPGETAVSVEDEQAVRHRVFCDRLLDGGRRCPLKAGHIGACHRINPDEDHVSPDEE
ncbi:hypothetical protein ACFP2T_03630 [Plantactinospora solaniradicis]|uniref:Uncharacterized protein n=1 Tax=Plantactinospora solaniradicis TaxID=1723736 RepID=A0ABW1K211_9ACTN